MFWNYLKTTWRTIKYNPFYSGINILGLTLGLTVGFLILLWVQHELSYNRFDGKVQNVYKVNSNIETNGDVQVWYNSPAAIAAFARTDVPDVRRVARVRGNWNYSVFSVGEEVFEQKESAYVDPDFFTLFQADFIEGNPNGPFLDDHSIVITRSLAEKLFGDEPALGKTIEGDFQDRYFISGVIADLPENSSVDYTMFFPMSIVAGWYDGSDENAYWKSMDSDWGNFNYATYLQLKPGASVSHVRDQLSQINARHDRNAADNHVERAYELQAIDQMNLYRPDGTSTGMQRIQIFIIVALITLIIACINYVNLSTARAVTRAKEVSMRKIVGAARGQLFFQFVWESLCFIFLALLCSVSLVWLLLPYFNALIGGVLHFNLLDPSVWKLILGVSLFILLASSLYPAILLSSFKPLEALKGKITGGMGKQRFRPVLVTVQFVFSAALIIGTLVIGQQLDYLQSRDPGYARDQILMFNAQGKMVEHMGTVKAELAKMPGVEDVSLSDQKIYSLGRTTGDFEWEGKDPDKSMVIKPFGIDTSFIPMMDMELLAGRNFTGSKQDSVHCILNEAAVREMGLTDPVGKRFSLWGTQGTILGVIKDFNYQSLKFGIEPVVLFYSPNSSIAYIKTAAENLPETLQATERLWKQYNGKFHFHYTFLDEGYQAQYKSEQTTAKLFNIFSIIAVVIACLGLFGLATYSSKVRVKEIGIRKVVGASIGQIILMLSLDFIRWVCLALVIAFPIAYFTMHHWLDNFYYRISIEWYVFALSGVLVLLVALLTISVQSVRAALANPVESLRDE